MALMCTRPEGVTTSWSLAGGRPRTLFRGPPLGSAEEACATGSDRQGALPRGTPRGGDSLFPPDSCDENLVADGCLGAESDYFGGV